MSHPRPMFELIIEATCKYYDITEVELKQKTSKQDIVHRRKIAIFLLRKHIPSMSYKSIAKFMGLTDHGWPRTIMSEIETGQTIYPHISHDIRNIMIIVNTLV